jgi:hypothetical protein
MGEGGLVSKFPRRKIGMTEGGAGGKCHKSRAGVGLEGGDGLWEFACCTLSAQVLKKIGRVLSVVSYDL